MNEISKNELKIIKIEQNNLKDWTKLPFDVHEPTIIGNHQTTTWLRSDCRFIIVDAWLYMCAWLCIIYYFRQLFIKLITVIIFVSVIYKAVANVKAKVSRFVINFNESSCLCMTHNEFQTIWSRVRVNLASLHVRPCCRVTKTMYNTCHPINNRLFLFYNTEMRCTIWLHTIYWRQF